MAKKHPVYGYRRDYFGRIDKRDEYFEERPQGGDSMYQDNTGIADYEDDHDSFYDSPSWE